MQCFCQVAVRPESNQRLDRTAVIESEKFRSNKGAKRAPFKWARIGLHLPNQPFHILRKAECSQMDISVIVVILQP